MRKARAFRGGANKTAPPCETGTGNKYLATVPGEQLQRRCLTENPALRENRFSASGKRGFHPCFCLPACCNCPVALLELATLILMIQLCLNGTVFKNAIAAGKTDSKNNLLRKCGLLAHTSAAFLKNCCTEKLFNCLWLVLGIPSESGSARLGHIPSLPWKSQLPLKPYLLLQPFIFKGNCDSFDSLLDFCLISLNSFYLLRKCGLLAHTSAAFLKNCCTEKLFICLRLEICYLLSV